MIEYEKRGYLLENFRLFHLHTPQGAKVDYHYHDFYKILFFRSGAGDYIVEGQRYRLQPGDIVLVGSRCVHRPEIEEGQPYERVILYIDPGYLQSSSTEACQLAEIFQGGAVLRLREKHGAASGVSVRRKLRNIALPLALAEMEASFVVLHSTSFL